MDRPELDCVAMKVLGPGENVYIPKWVIHYTPVRSSMSQHLRAESVGPRRQYFAARRYLISSRKAFILRGHGTSAAARHSHGQPPSSANKTRGSSLWPICIRLKNVVY